MELTAHRVLDCEHTQQLQHEHEATDLLHVYKTTTLCMLGKPEHHESMYVYCPVYIRYIQCFPKC